MPTDLHIPVEALNCTLFGLNSESKIELWFGDAIPFSSIRLGKLISIDRSSH